MWYAVLKQELTLQEKFAGSTFTVPAGTIWTVKKGVVDGVEGVVAVNIDEAYENGPMYLHVNEARNIFTKPINNLNDAYEESFAVCEAVYC